MQQQQQQPHRSAAVACASTGWVYSCAARVCLGVVCLVCVGRVGLVPPFCQQGTNVDTPTAHTYGYRRLAHAPTLLPSHVHRSPSPSPGAGHQLLHKQEQQHSALLPAAAVPVA